MADVVIRGLEMPKDGCFRCWLDNYCFKMGYGKFGNNGACPLLAIPEVHGRLVDAREVLEKADKAPWFDGDVSELGLLLGSEVTTIVPAEGGGEDG